MDDLTLHGWREQFDAGVAQLTQHQRELARLQQVLLNLIQDEFSKQQQGFEQQLASLVRIRDAMKILAEPLQHSDVPVQKNVAAMIGGAPPIIAAPSAPDSAVGRRHSRISDSIRTVLMEARGAHLTPVEIRDRLLPEYKQHANLLNVVHNTLRRMEKKGEIARREVGGRAAYATFTQGSSEVA